MKPNFKPKAFQRKALCSAIALAGLSVAAGSATAAEYWLRAVAMNANFNGTSVPMWGYQDCTIHAGFAACPANALDWAPGRRLVVPPGDTTLTVHLQNQLPEPTSLLIPGLPKAMNPQFFAADDANFAGRMRSLDVEAASGSGTQNYTWATKPGSYLYMSGTHQQVQVQMGLYGVVAADASATEAYPGVSKAADLTLLFSEVEPKLHADVAGNNYGPGHTRSSTIYNTPSWFLLNGKPFVPGVTPAISTDDSGAALSAAVATRVRLLNAGLHSHVPTFGNATLKLVAEDGKPGPFGAVEQYHVNLPPLKSVDALLTTAPAATVTVYDRQLRTTSPIQTIDSYGVPVQASVPGGMMAKLVMQGDLGAPPDAPVLVATANNPGQVSLGWSDLLTETGYALYRDGNLLANLGPNVTGYVDTGLNGGTAYAYTLVASNAGGSTVSNVANVITPVGESLVAASGLVANYAGTTLANSGVSLNFTDNSVGEAGYKVEFCRGTSTQCTATTLLAEPYAETANLGLASANRWYPLPVANVSVTSPAGPGSASAQLSGLNMTRAGYFFRVSARGAASTGLVSNISPYMNLAATPAAPTAFTSVAGAVGSANLGWTDVANGNNSYLVQQRSLTGVFSIGFTSANTGYGYTVAPSVYVAAPTLPGGVQATAHAVLVTANVSGVGTQSGVVRIVMDNPGKGYSAAPVVTVSGGTRVGGRAYGPATVLRSNYTATGSTTWASGYTSSVTTPTPVPGDAPGTTVTGLTTGTAYQWRIRSTGVTGTGQSALVVGSNSVVAP